MTGGSFEFHFCDRSSLLSVSESGNSMASGEPPAKEVGFKMWLSKKLLQLNEDVDLEVFVSYIEGILEEDMPNDEKQESLSGLLGEILLTDNGVVDHCTEIQRKWEELFLSTSEPTVPKEMKSLDETIHGIIEQQNINAVRIKVIDEAQTQRKAAILANYAELTDEDDSSDETAVPCTATASATASPAAAAAGPTTSEDLLVKNMNALLVKERENKERDRQKAESDQKRLKDREDRDKQKQKQQDRKDTEKKRTQKGEKKR